MKTQPKIDPRQSEAVLLTKNFQKYPREVVASLAARYRPELKRWAASCRRKYCGWRPRIPARDYEAVALDSIRAAAKNYDSSKGACFKTFLGYFVRWDCFHYAKENGDLLKVYELRRRRVDQDEEEAESTVVYAIPWDDLTDSDHMQAADADENLRRDPEKKEARRAIQEFREFLNELLEGRGLQENKKRLTVPQKRAALVLEYVDFFLEHADDPSMSRFMKTAFLASKGKRGQETLNNALDYVHSQFARNAKCMTYKQTNGRSTN